MAQIETRKELLIGKPKQGTMQLSLAPGVVSQTIDNDGVVHTARMDPNEAVQLGVALIQLASQAMAMQQQQQVQLAQGLNGVPHPPRG